MTGPPPAIRVRRGAPPPRRPAAARRPPGLCIGGRVVQRPVVGAPAIPYTNVFTPTGPGVPCVVSKCVWDAEHWVTFHQTGGTWPYCGDHSWPYRPRREVRQRGLPSGAEWETA